MPDGQYHVVLASEQNTGAEGRSFTADKPLMDVVDAFCEARGVEYEEKAANITVSMSISAFADENAQGTEEATATIRTMPASYLEFTFNSQSHANMIATELGSTLRTHKAFENWPLIVVQYDDSEPS